MPEREQGGLPEALGTVSFVPDWAMPPGVRAIQTERGVGQAPFGGFNLGDHVGDEEHRVRSNRQALSLGLGVRPVWLNQVHGTTVCTLTSELDGSPEADGSISQLPGVACAIMTADCMPVLVADRHARVVGAAHAGWRGLAAGVLQSLIRTMTAIPGVRPQDLTVWLGPAIGPMAFEIGFEVRDAFVAQSVAHKGSFLRHPKYQDKLLADLPALATRILQDSGVKDITASGLCTFNLADRFYSYRREGITGRMASLIWLNQASR